MLSRPSHARQKRVGDLADDEKVNALHSMGNLRKREAILRSPLVLEIVQMFWALDLLADDAADEALKDRGEGKLSKHS